MDSQRPQAQKAPPGPQSAIGPEQFDPAGESLAEALRISFWLLKFVMVALVVVYLFLGIFAVPQEQVALVLRFGKILGRPGEQVLGPGAHWAWPFPVDQVVLIKAKRVETVDMRTFWYAMNEGDVQRAYEGTQEFRADKIPGGEGGYLITGDRNIINTIWRINYRIGDHEDAPMLFYRNVADDVSDEKARRMIKLVVQACVVQATGSFEIYDALIYKVNELTRAVTRAAQGELDRMKTGLKISSIERVYGIPPLNVKGAFDRVLVAKLQVDEKRRAADGYRNKILSRAGGGVGIELGRVLGRLSEEMFKSLPDPKKLAVLEKEVSGLYLEAGGQVAAERQKALSDKDAMVADVQGEGEFIALLMKRYEKDVERLNIYLGNYRIDKFKTVVAGAEDRYVLTVGGDETIELRAKISPPPSLLKKKQVVEKQR